MERLTYAIVDIETTGTNHANDRIIQIGIALVVNKKIVQTYATDIHPGKHISPIIEKLTGITNERVKSAPYFEDVADTLYSLLSGTVFVAHNIHFDFNFLNVEFRRVGLPELDIHGVDTVELAQIFLPTQPSYKLSSLAHALNFQHDNPHQADSDAFATAKLLLEIEERIENTPTQTLKQIVHLSDVLAADNHLFLERRLGRRILEESKSLNEDLQVVESLVLKKQVVATTEILETDEHYPKSKKQKEKLFGDVLDFRESQGKFMNMVYQHFEESETKNLFVEASTGIGKTFGYLLPLAYLATTKKKAIIATPSIVLQNQLVEQDLPIAQKITPTRLRATLVKSARHYLDLSRFAQSLKRPLKQKQYRLYQMSVLVWLTQTETGDLSELNYTNLNHLFFEQVTHRGKKDLNPFSPFYSVDFFKRVLKEMEKSNVLVVNHAFLLQETLRKDFDLPESDFLIIDEAHHLPSVLTTITKEQIELNGLQRKLRQFGEEQALESLFDCLKDKPIKHKLRLIQLLVMDAQKNLELFLSNLHLHLPEKEEVFIDQAFFGQANISYECELLIKNFEELTVVFEEIHTHLVHETKNFSGMEHFLLQPVLDFGDEIQAIRENFEIFTRNWSPNYAKWLTILPKRQTLTLNIQNFDKTSLETTSWYERYRKILYTSGTLKVGNKKDFIPKQLGIEDYRMKSVPAPFEYEQQGRLFVPTDLSIEAKETPEEMAEILAKAVLEITNATDESTLFLFTSHLLLQEVRRIVLPAMEEKARMLLAQNFNGSKERMLKQFRQNHGAVLFGTDSFWEGIDLPGDHLKVLVVTKLPFENPRRPMVKSYYEYIETQGHSPFASISVPKAALRLRQGLGRLIRSKDDKGVMIVLDRRLMTKSYGKRLLNALPKELPKIYEKMEEFLFDLPDFLL